MGVFLVESPFKAWGAYRAVVADPFADFAVAGSVFSGCPR